MQRVYVLFLVTGILGVLGHARAQTQYVTDGTPTGLEEEIRWRGNRGRFDSASENQTRATAYADVPASSGPLAPNQSLTVAARHHSEDMARQNLFQHATVTNSAFYNPVTQPNPWDRMTAEGYSWNSAGENIAAGYSGAEAVYVGWWNSTGHRVNMYNSGLREIGNGYFNWNASTYHSYYTMDLGSSGSTRFFTDTLFRDTSGNGTYEQGEGIAGVAVRLVVAGKAHTSYDLSTSVGSFAIPIQSIASGASVQVVLSNTTAAQVQLSIPKDYRVYNQFTLAPNQSKVLGTFTQPAAGRNAGLRDVVPAPATANPPQVLLAKAGTDLLVSWRSETNLEYVVQRSTNLLNWSDLSPSYQAGSGTNMTWRDAAAGSRRQNYYRVLLRGR